MWMCKGWGDSGSPLQASALATFAYQLRFRNFLNWRLLFFETCKCNPVDRSNGRDRFGYGVTGAYYGVGHYSTLSGSHTKLPLWGLHERSDVAPAFLFVLQTTVLKDIELHPNLYHLSGVAPTDDSHRFDNQQLGSEELNPKKNERIKNNKSSCWPLVTEDVRDVRLGSRS